MKQNALDSRARKAVLRETSRVTVAPVIPQNWSGLFVALRESSAFATLATLSASSLEVNALATQLLGELQSAAIGLPRPAVLSAMLAQVTPLLSAGELASVQSALATNNVVLPNP